MFQGCNNSLLYVDFFSSLLIQRCRNHSCSPNCVSWHLSIDRKLRIGLFTSKFVSYGQELTWDYGLSYSLCCLCASGKCSEEVLDDDSANFKNTWMSLLIEACSIDDDHVDDLIQVLCQYRFGGKILEESGPLWLKLFCALGLKGITTESERQLRMPLLAEFADRVIICMRGRIFKRWVLPVFAIDVPEIEALKHFCKSLRPKRQGWMFLEQKDQCLILDPYDVAANVYCVKLKKNSWFRSAFKFADWHTLKSSICNIGLQNSPKRKPKTHAAKFHEKTAVLVKGPERPEKIDVELLLLLNDAENAAASVLAGIENADWQNAHYHPCEGIKLSEIEKNAEVLIEEIKQQKEKEAQQHRSALPPCDLQIKLIKLHQKNIKLLENKNPNSRLPSSDEFRIVLRQLVSASQTEIKRDFPILYTLPRQRCVACILATCPGDSEDFGVWLGCVPLFASDACCVKDMCCNYCFKNFDLI